MGDEFSKGCDTGKEYRTLQSMASCTVSLCSMREEPGTQRLLISLEETETVTVKSASLHKETWCCGSL